MNKITVEQFKEWLEKEIIDTRRDFGDGEGSIQDSYVEGLQKALAKASQIEDKAGVTGEMSDGYHTFNELYDHRIALYLDIVAQNSEWFWKSKKHEDGSEFAGWFILGGNMGTGDISYHLPLDKWDMAKCKEITLGKKWDGHTAKDVVERILRHSQAPNTSRPAPKPTEEGLREVLSEISVQSDEDGVNWIKLPYAMVSINNKMGIVKKNFIEWDARRRAALSRHPVTPSQEPLEDLAKRKGFYIAYEVRYTIGISLKPSDEPTEFKGEDRGGAVKEARAYLESLEDIKGGK